MQIPIASVKIIYMGNQRHVGRPSKLTSEQWDKIKDAYLLGETSTRIAKRYGLKPSTIRARASKEGWPTPRNLKVKIAEQINEVKVKQLKGEIPYHEAERQMNHLDTVAKTLYQRQEAHRQTIAEIVDKKIKTNKVPEIKTWKDLDTADRIQRRALEMDKDSPDAVINVGVLGSAEIVDETKKVK